MTVCTADRQECGQSNCPICSQKNGLHNKDVADRNLLGVGTEYGYCISDYLRMIFPYSLLTTSEKNRAEKRQSSYTAPSVQKNYPPTEPSVCSIMLPVPRSISMLLTSDELAFEMGFSTN